MPGYYSYKRGSKPLTRIVLTKEEEETAWSSFIKKFPDNKRDDYVIIGGAAKVKIDFDKTGTKAISYCPEYIVIHHKTLNLVWVYILSSIRELISNK